MGWVGNGGVDINWDISPVSSPYTMLSHYGKISVKGLRCAGTLVIVSPQKISLIS